MKAVFLYAGQGSQKVGMGKDFYQEFPEYREFVDSMKFDVDFKTMMEEGPIEELSDTKNTQPCMSLFAAGITMLLKKNGIEPQAAMGLSLGEYGALYAAGVFSAEEYVKMTAYRGSVMAEAAKGLTCSMSAILGAASETVEQACKEYQGSGYVTVANYNCPGQYVICGDEEAVADTEKRLVEMGAKRCVRLNVSGPFHTKFMQPAGEKLKAYLDNITFEKPSIPVALNVTGDFYQGEDLKENLIKQIQTSVRLENDIRNILDKGYDNFVEIGPGNVVSGFLKKTAREMGKTVTVQTIETVEDFRKLMGE